MRVANFSLDNLIPRRLTALQNQLAAIFTGTIRWSMAIPLLVVRRIPITNEAFLSMGDILRLPALIMKHSL